MKSWVHYRSQFNLQEMKTIKIQLSSKLKVELISYLMVWKIRKMKTNDDVKFFIQSYFVNEDLKIKTNNYVDDIPVMKYFTKGPYSLNMNSIVRSWLHSQVGKNTKHYL